MKLLIALLLGICAQQSYAQEKTTVKFGKVSAEDFNRKVYAPDSNANAVVIAELGNTTIVGNSKGSFSLEFKRYKRVHILNKNGYDIANVEIALYTNGTAEEELESLKAVTYNVDNGKVVETKLDTKAGVFKDKINKNLIVKKFTFPNIKEGCIIEMEYRIQSDFTFNLQPWEFQGSYPCLWSEYNVSIPEFYYYVRLSQGYRTFHIQDKKDRNSSFSVSDNTSSGRTDQTKFDAAITDYRWVMKDVPAIKEESYTSTVNNHVSRIEFQLAELRHPFTPRNVMGSWQDACKSLLKDEDFGYSINRDNGWLGDVVKEATKDATTNLGKARNIYAYVRDNLTCTNYNRKYLEKPLKTVLKQRNGNEAEINLLLTAMLIKAGLQADPVMLSTRQHGYVYAMYPLLNRFNYVISQVAIDGNTYYMDASRPTMGFGRLASDTYNGHARVINENATPVELVADSLTESKITSVMLINSDKGEIEGSVAQSPGYYESYKLRNRINEKGKDQLFADIKKDFNADIEITESAIDSLKEYDQPLGIRYFFKLTTNQEDILYFNPLFGEAWKENPFKSAERTYPVEMPYTIDEMFTLRMDVPKGYVVDEMPKQIMLKLNEEGDGFFEYRLSVSEDIISLRSRIRLKRAFFQPEEYEMLREFFNLVVKKQGEQIVFKKKK